MKKRTLTFKLVAGGVAAVLVPLAIVGVIASMKASSYLTDAAEEKAAQHARALAEMVENVLKVELNVAKSIAASNEAVTALTTGKTEDMNRFLAAAIAATGTSYESVVMTNAEGIVVADSAGGSRKGVSMADRTYVQDAKAGKASVGAVVKSKFSGKPVAPVAAPVMKNGQVLGVIAVPVDIDFLSEKIVAKNGETGYGFMTNKEGVCVAHPDKANILALDFKTVAGMEDIAKLMMSGKSGVENYVFKGVRKIAGTAPVPLTGWSVCVTQNEDEFLAGARSIRNYIALAVVIFLTITVVCVIAFARRISNSIKHAVVQMSEGANQVSAAASQVSAASQSLAEGASEQASSIEETSSSLEEMSAMTKRNADHSVQAESMMRQTQQIVSNANTSLDGLTHSMKDISEASVETSKIIRTIDEIAFQTNLLALNAAVEAARAGEAGAGFAVVAEEVRNLAIRAAAAAKNTATLIEGTVDKIKDGSELVVKTNDAFGKVSDSSSKVAALISEIAQASKEQAQGIDQINTAVSEMEKVTQMNAANAEESAAASEELNAQADQMSQISRVLADIVGGSGETRAVVQSTHRVKAPSAPAVAVKEVKKALPHQARRSASREVDPEAIIPMHEGHFKEF